MTDKSLLDFDELTKKLKEAVKTLVYAIDDLEEDKEKFDRLLKGLRTRAEELRTSHEPADALIVLIDFLKTEEKEFDRFVNDLRADAEKLANLIPQITRLVTPEIEERRETIEVRGPPVVLRCKLWEDFKALAHQPQRLSFLYKEAEKTYQVVALKSNQIITYSGDLPNQTSFLKAWLTKQLNIPEKEILEGTMTLA